MAGQFAPFRLPIAASALVLVALVSGCAHGTGAGASGNALHSETDVQKMKFIMGFRNALGQPCRVVEQPVVINGEKIGATSTMCQQPDGHWVVEGAR